MGLELGRSRVGGDEFGQGADRERKEGVDEGIVVVAGGGGGGWSNLGVAESGHDDDDDVDGGGCSFCCIELRFCCKLFGDEFIATLRELGAHHRGRAKMSIGSSSWPPNPLTAIIGQNGKGDLRNDFLVYFRREMLSPRLQCHE
ncbi:hypothetical protein ACFE04_029217 [Oxalis oulophora]